jgi:hypothetical protein
MWSFRFWRLLREQLDAEAYNALFDDELERLLPHLTDPVQLQNAQGMRGFNWTGYIAGAVRRSGFTNQNEIEEKVHEIVVRMLVRPGGLFRDYGENHGPFPLRFKRTLANALKNLTEKERNRRRFIPSIPIGQGFVPGGVTDLAARSTPEGDPEVIGRFREMVRRHLGQQALSVFDARMQGEEMKDLPISPYNTKKLVQEIKDLARRYAVAVADPDLLAQIERLMASEERTVQRRQATMRQRVGVAG